MLVMCPVSYDVQKVTMICVVLLQNCVGFVEGETGYCSETCEMCDGGTGEVSIKAEEAIDIKEEGSIKFEAVYIEEEIPAFIKVPPTKTEPEVRVWDCVCVSARERKSVCSCMVERGSVWVGG
jgi:hypothetical protein